MSNCKKFDLELGHDERIEAQCRYQQNNEYGSTYLTRYTVEGDDKLVLLADKSSGTYREIVSRDGAFADFPGIEYEEEWLARFEYAQVDEYVRYRANILRHSDESFLFLWTIQPYCSDPGDEDGYGMEEQPQIRLYSHLDRSGRFTDPFRLYSIAGDGYYSDPAETLRVIFLDFDGVLNSRRYLEKHGGVGVAIDPARLELLKQLVYATDAEIVLSTSWRSHWSIIGWMGDAVGQEINRIFDSAGLYVYDKTPDLGRNRDEEIAAWLKAHPQVKSFVVLDDEPFGEGILRDHFVLTSRLRNGLDEDDVQAAVRILNGNQGSNT